MKKIIAAFDGLRFSENTLEEAIAVARAHQAHLVGVFLHEFTARGFVVYEAMVSGSENGRDAIAKIRTEDAATYKASVDTFEAACQAAGLEYTIHRDNRSALKELLHESIFADLIVIDPGETFSYIDEDMPGWFIKSVLHEAHCPIWLAHGTLQPVDRVIFLYDGSSSSMYAIKMLTYLFPEMTEKQMVVLSVKSGSLNLHVPDNKLVHEWMKRHYPKATYNVVQGDVSQLISLCKEHGSNILLVAGAYERGKVSTWLRASLSDELMRHIKAPLFITHA
jgi:nucleotide-binding universal stress UspA family protein